MKTRSSSRRIQTVDRLSCLPDEIICHILSFLPTKRSVQTSLLSKRWTLLWAHVPCFEFRVCGAFNSKIVTKILLQHKHDIHTFNLYDQGFFGGREDEFESWIVNITTRNVHNLVMDLKYQFVLPRCIFTCKTLVDLSLSCCGDIPMSGIYLPSLKKLKLYCVQYESHESFSHLISGCPLLEELSVEGKVLVWGRCCLSSPTLTRLVIKSYSGEVFEFGLKLDTPALKYLSLHCFMPDILTAGALDSLVEADVCLSSANEHQDNFIYSRNLSKFLGNLYNVKHLKLYAHRLVALHDSAFFDSAVKFHNLTKLELCSNLGLVRSFLENANNLQAFKINCSMTLRHGHVDNQLCWMQPKQVPACLISHLQSVNLYFCGSQGKFEMVKYILMNAKVLKVMKIHILYRKCYWKKRFEVLERRRRRLFESTLENDTLCSIEIA